MKLARSDGWGVRAPSVRAGHVGRASLVTDTAHRTVSVFFHPRPNRVSKAKRPRKRGRGGKGRSGMATKDEAAEKLIYLAIRGHEKTARTVRGWLTAVNQFAIMFEDRFKPIQG